MVSSQIALPPAVARLLNPLLVALALTGSLFLSIYPARAQEVQVAVEPEDYSVEYFDPHNLPNPPPPLPPGEDAVTDWKFNVGTHFNFAFLRRDENPGACHVLIKITEDQLIIRLKTIIYLPKGATPQLVAHEDGHRRIVQMIYKDGEAISNNCGNSILGKEYTGDGADLASAQKEAIAKATKELCACIMQRINERCKRVSDEYDRITRHGRNPIAVDKAIKEAFAKAR